MYSCVRLACASGLDITDEQLAQMRSQVDNIDWAYAAQKEAEFRHDVMGHIHAFGHVCPKVLSPSQKIGLSTPAAEVFNFACFFACSRSQSPPAW